MPLARITFYFKYIPKYSASHEYFFQPNKGIICKKAFSSEELAYNSSYFTPSSYISTFISSYEQMTARPRNNDGGGIGFGMTDWPFIIL